METGRTSTMKRHRGRLMLQHRELANSRRIVGRRRLYYHPHSVHAENNPKSTFVPALSDRVYLSVVSFAIPEDSSFFQLLPTFRPEARVRIGRCRSMAKPVVRGQICIRIPHDDACRETREEREHDSRLVSSLSLKRTTILAPGVGFEPTRPARTTG